ncbi:cupin domain-containing protein [Litorihabitans aurantiacus]|uniref:Cupin domain-containing protein n=1 Tax=Litorihabitans aurantiacus TaxID=1930061 RepID=A0AA38CUG8_9MICO|nr:hypothetical protein GCM10025875_33630 [Litorihabitans aurantiacus]
MGAERCARCAVLGARGPAAVARPAAARGRGSARPRGEATYTATLLAACPPGARRDVYLIEADPGTPRRSAAHATGTREHVVLSAGRALVGPTDDPVELAPGDYLTYPGDEPHVFEALVTGTTAVLLSERG